MNCFTTCLWIYMDISLHFLIILTTFLHFLNWFLNSYSHVHDSSCPSREVNYLINLNRKKLLRLELIAFWRLFNFILSPGTIFNAELLDLVTIEMKMDFVLLLVLAYDFCISHYLMPQLHFRN